MYYRGIFIPITLSLLPIINCDVKPPVIDSSILTPSKTVGDCQACKIFIESLIKGLQRTSRGKFEGGDAAWEEEKLKKSYKHSEMRLIDIQEGLCKGEKYSAQCHHMAEKAEDLIEEWWTTKPEETDSLYESICIEKLQVCCPKNHFGRDCTPCPGDHSNLCSNNGKCRGDGTRKGNGTCLCAGGYDGDNCEKCAAGYYMASGPGEKLICLRCHMSCLGDCRQGSPKDCVACKPGFSFDAEEGCTDIDECDDVKTCKENQFCLNSLGSYKCVDCDKSCKGCHGDGPDLCRKCSKGYSKKGELCIADREDENKDDELTSTRNEEL